MGLYKIQVSQIYDLSDSLYKEEAIVTVSLRLSGELSVLTVDSPDYFNRGNEVHSKETNYRALFIKENNILATEIKNDRWNYHFVQSIND